jgi:PTS system galactitol-specific IIA component
MIAVTEENVLINIEAATAEEVIRRLNGLLVERGCATAAYAELLIEREAKYPTGLPTEGAKVAIPHAFAEKGEVLVPAIACATLARPVIFKNMADPDDELEVGIVFLLALKGEHESAGDLEKVMGLFSDGALLAQLAAAKTAKEFVSLISSHGGHGETEDTE